MSASDDGHFYNELLDRNLIRSAGDAGLYVISASFERVVQGLARYIMTWFEVPPRETFVYPPVAHVDLNDISGYAENFPQFAGFVASARGQSGTPINSLPGAGCHPLLSSLADKAVRGGIYGTVSYVYRNEVSPTVVRMKSFRQAEVVYVGPAAGLDQQLAHWRVAGPRLWASIGIGTYTARASDPFTGRLGQLRREWQAAGGAKTEECLEAGPWAGLALSSVNNHGSIFTDRFRITDESSQPVVSGCIGFGLERSVLAMLSTHGTHIHSWPATVQDRLLLKEVEI